MSETTISKNLDENEKFLKSKIGQSFDTNYRKFNILSCNNRSALIVYISGLVDTKSINDYILTPLMTLPHFGAPNNLTNKADVANWIINSGISLSGARGGSEWSDICDSIMEGHSILFIGNSDIAIILSTNEWKSRTIQEPLNETEPRGPRDGFVEDIQTNTAIIRRRIKDYNLRFESIYIGERTKTRVSIVYIDSIVNKSVL